MAKSLSRICAVLITTCALFTSGSALADAKYGFGSAGGAGLTCTIWALFFPMSFKQPGVSTYTYSVNVIWIDDDGVGAMDDYYDFFVDPKGNSTWPSSRNGPVAHNQGIAYCAVQGECTANGDGARNRGISSYNDLVKEFPNDTVKVFKFLPNGDGATTWMYMPTRKYKLLRVEVFTPYKEKVAALRYRVEPIYFEYRATGNGTELKLKEWGSTDEHISQIHLPDTFTPVSSADIRVWFTEYDSYSAASISASTEIDALTPEQITRIPQGCI